MEETTQALVERAQDLTSSIQAMVASRSVASQQRRDIWAELNRRGISQIRIAKACGVVEHTVYTELRKRREAAA